MSDGDVVSRIASDAGLQTDIDGADAQHAYLIQDNQTDYAFLAERALLTGLELSVDDETIRFKKPAAEGTPVELAWDSGLLSFTVRVTAADQVSEVEVRGWDPEPEAGHHLDHLRQRRRPADRRGREPDPVLGVRPGDGPRDRSARPR